MLLSVPMQRKEPCIETDRCVIEKTVELSKDEYEHFKNNLLQDYSFIQECADDMYQEDNGIRHCLLVLGEGCSDGILVDSQGSAYARYSAAVPHARELLMLDTYPSLAQFCSEMSQQVQSCVDQALDGHEYGQAVAFLDEEAVDDIIYFNEEMFKEMLSERPEIDAFTVRGNEIDIALNTDHVPRSDMEGYRLLTAEDLEIMCAKHILWLHEAGGEQANFSGCAVSGGNLSGKNLNNAILDGGKFVDTNLSSAELCFASMQGAEFVRCDFAHATAEEAQAQGSDFISCQFPGAIFTHSNLAGASFKNCSMEYFGMDQCCIESTAFENSSVFAASMCGVSENEEQWQGDGMCMTM